MCRIFIVTRNFYRSSSYLAFNFVGLKQRPWLYISGEKRPRCCQDYARLELIIAPTKAEAVRKPEPSVASAIIILHLYSYHDNRLAGNLALYGQRPSHTAAMASCLPKRVLDCQHLPRMSLANDVQPAGTSDHRVYMPVAARLTLLSPRVAQE